MGKNIDGEGHTPHTEKDTPGGEYIWKMTNTKGNKHKKKHTQKRAHRESHTQDIETDTPRRGHSRRRIYMENDTKDGTNLKRDKYERGYIEVDKYRRDMHGGEYIWKKTYIKGDTHRGRWKGEEDYIELSTKNKDYIEWSILIKYIK